MENENNNNYLNKFDKNYHIYFTMNPVTAAFIALIGIFILYQVGGAILTVLIFGFNIDNADINAMRLLTMGGQILLLLLPTLIFARAVYPNDVTPVLRAKLPTFKEIVFFIIGLIILLPLLQSYLLIQNYLLDQLANVFPLLKKLMELLDQMDKLVESTYTKLLKANSFFESSFVVFLVAVVPAICEEILFRGFVQKSFELKFKPYSSIFITSLFFGLYHFNPYGLVALISLGFYFGYAVYKSNSIIVSMILHFLNNFLTVIAFFIFGSEEIMSSSVKNQGPVLPSFLLFIFLLIAFLSFIYYLNKNYDILFHKKESEI
ncbi:MAG: CPBP family intramembrane metalloprotease [Melioribacteraceae bacterium]|nr:CPBP family intramembrane metalloprotease [Melioribacteraceae bacterium]